MGCSCGSGSSASGEKHQVQAPGGAVTSWRTAEEAEAAAARTGGKVL